MFNIGGFLFAILVMVFITWIMLPNNANERYAHACAPVQWAGNVAVSTAAFIAPSGEAGTKRTFDSMDYFCRFSIWRLFNEDAYRAWLTTHPEGYQSIPQQNSGETGNVSSPQEQKGAQ